MAELFKTSITCDFMDTLINLFMPNLPHQKRNEPVPNQLSMPEQENLMPRYTRGTRNIVCGPEGSGKTSFVSRMNLSLMCQRLREIIRESCQSESHVSQMSEKEKLHMLRLANIKRLRSTLSFEFCYGNDTIRELSHLFIDMTGNENLRSHIWTSCFTILPQIRSDMVKRASRYSKRTQNREETTKSSLSMPITELKGRVMDTMARSRNESERIMHAKSDILTNITSQLIDTVFLVVSDDNSAENVRSIHVAMRDLFICISKYMNGMGATENDRYEYSLINSMVDRNDIQWKPSLCLIINKQKCRIGQFVNDMKGKVSQNILTNIGTNARGNGDNSNYVGRAGVCDETKEQSDGFLYQGRLELSHFRSLIEVSQCDMFFRSVHLLECNLSDDTESEEQMGHILDSLAKKSHPYKHASIYNTSDVDIAIFRSQ